MGNKSKGPVKQVTIKNAEGKEKVIVFRTTGAFGTPKYLSPNLPIGYKWHPQRKQNEEKVS